MCASLIIIGTSGPPGGGPVPPSPAVQDALGAAGWTGDVSACGQPPSNARSVDSRDAACALAWYTPGSGRRELGGLGDDVDQSAITDHGDGQRRADGLAEHQPLQVLRAG